jgi:predicted ATP-grasp superfamily ATP-dependent carboligase
MNIDWQTWTVLALVSVAGAYLGRAAWRSMSLRKTSTCATCGNCSNAASGRQIVGIEELNRTAKSPAGTASTIVDHTRGDQLPAAIIEERLPRARWGARQKRLKVD